MLELPTNIQLLLLDHIVSAADLKALCLTCTSIRAIATPRLYQNIRLHVQTNHIVRFLKSIAAGAGRHLRHTRGLTFEVWPPPSEPATVQTSPPNVKLNHQPYYNMNNPFDEQLYIALEMMSDHGLSTLG